jgi:hypothetical protein
MISYCERCNGIWRAEQQTAEQHVEEDQHGPDRPFGCSIGDIGRCAAGESIWGYFVVTEIARMFDGKVVCTPVISVRVLVSFEEEWEDTGSVESGPDPRCYGYKIVPLVSELNLIDRIKESCKEPDLDFSFQLGWPVPGRPPYYC